MTSSVPMPMYMPVLLVGSTCPAIVPVATTAQTRVLPLLFWIARALSSVGRAPARQAGGHWFEPSSAHPGRPGLAPPNTDLIPRAAWFATFFVRGIDRVSPAERHPTAGVDTRQAGDDYTVVSQRLAEQAAAAQGSLLDAAERFRAEAVASLLKEGERLWDEIAGARAHVGVEAADAIGERLSGEHKRFVEQAGQAREEATKTLREVLTAQLEAEAQRLVEHGTAELKKRAEALEAGVEQRGSEADRERAQELTRAGEEIEARLEKRLSEQVQAEAQRLFESTEARVVEQAKSVSQESAAHAHSEVEQRLHSAIDTRAAKEEERLVQLRAELEEGLSRVEALDKELREERRRQRETTRRRR